MEGESAEAQVLAQIPDYALEAERRMGELLAKPENKARGTAGVGRPKLGGNTVRPPKSNPPTLADLGVSKRESVEARTG